jgi:hypothetical protein
VDDQADAVHVQAAGGDAGPDHGAELAGSERLAGRAATARGGGPVDLAGRGLS